MSEHLVYGFNGSQVLCECREGGWLTRQEFAAHTKAEALAPVLALADECERLDAYLSHDVTDLTSPMGWRGVNRPAWEVIRTAAALRVAAGTPTHHTTEEES